MGETYSTTYRLTPASGTSPTAPALQSYDLFATRIWQARLEALQPHFAEWTRWILELRATHPAPAGRTNRQGWNSQEMAILEQARLAPLRQVVRLACAQALAEMGRAEQAFEIQSWVNLHDRGGFNFLHLHEASLLSGSFYLKVPPGSGDLVFRDPRPGVLHHALKGSFPNAHADINLRPSAGLLVLFPCWMEHFVEPHAGDEPRICIAFNANK
jgi:uncharacterized protein (TIGR02466 family)